MNRINLIEKAYQRKKELSLNEKRYKSFLDSFLKLEMKSDLEDRGDITAKYLLIKNDTFTSIIEAKEDGIVAGVEEAEYIYKKNKIKVKVHKKDGSSVKKGQKILTLKGKESALLKTERAVLNIMQRMSGIATNARAMSRYANVCPTRKTVIGYLDRKAAQIGCGYAHRMGLWDSFLIKKNYIALFRKIKVDDPIRYPIAMLWGQRKKSNYINIEIETEKDAINAAQIYKMLNYKKDYPCIIMLDNFSPKRIKAIIKKMKQKKLYDYVLFEASGKIGPENIKEYGSSGADILSIGYLTHSAKALDMRQVILT